MRRDARGSPLAPARRRARRRPAAPAPRRPRRARDTPRRPPPGILAAQGGERGDEGLAHRQRLAVAPGGPEPIDDGAPLDRWQPGFPRGGGRRCRAGALSEQPRDRYRCRLRNGLQATLRRQRRLDLRYPSLHLRQPQADLPGVAAGLTAHEADVRPELAVARRGRQGRRGVQVAPGPERVGEGGQPPAQEEEPAALALAPNGRVQHFRRRREPCGGGERGGRRARPPARAHQPRDRAGVARPTEVVGHRIRVGPRR